MGCRGFSDRFLRRTGVFALYSFYAVFYPLFLLLTLLSSYLLPYTFRKFWTRAFIMRRFSLRSVRKPSDYRQMLSCSYLHSTMITSSTYIGFVRTNSFSNSLRYFNVPAYPLSSDDIFCRMTHVFKSKTLYHPRNSIYSGCRVKKLPELRTEHYIYSFLGTEVTG